MRGSKAGPSAYGGAGQGRAGGAGAADDLVTARPVWQRLALRGGVCAAFRTLHVVSQISVSRNIADHEAVFREQPNTASPTRPCDHTSPL